MSDIRRARLNTWVNQQLAELLAIQPVDVELSSVSGDASFRRYFRARHGLQSFIAVDAPPENENSELFVEIAAQLRDAGVRSPQVFAQDFAAGFMLLEDFGDRLYLPCLLELQARGSDAEAEHRIESLYEDAIAALVRLQLGVDRERLAPYDGAQLQREMQLFVDWFCLQFLEIELADGERRLIADSFAALEQAALAQPQLAVHRDYHSRNLLVLDEELFGIDAGPGIIDFQDAMAGAYSYDLVSLLRDCYIRWSPQFVEKMALSYLQQARAAGLVDGVASEQFLRDLDLMGLQRNLKVMGIFARLAIRDHKPQYLADIPLVIQYFLEVACKYEEMAPFLDWFETGVLAIAKSKLNLES